MAGSRKWFKYEDDRGDIFAIERDESNVEAVNAAVGDYANADTLPIYAVPRNLKPRYARYVSEDGRVTRNIVCLTVAVLANPANPIVDVVTGASLRLRSVVGERITAPLGFDTGLNDGDAT